MLKKQSSDFKRDWLIIYKQFINNSEKVWWSFKFWYIFGYKNRLDWRSVQEIEKRAERSIN